MAIRVALHHKTRYSFDRLVGLSPHEIRLRPAAHCRTAILGYSLTVEPHPHFLNWQQDPYGNYVARVVFPEQARGLEINVDLIADMTVINPFDFFVDSYAEQYPFRYAEQTARELAPFLETEAPGPLLSAWLQRFRADNPPSDTGITNFLVGVNSRLQADIAYLVRMEAGVQSCEETLGLRRGSCRDSGWLLVQILRHLGLAARFVSGYLIQLTADQKSLDGPPGPEHDFTDLHAWAEVYIPGAGWIGLDPTSGLLAGEGHIPLACTASPTSAAPITGFTDVCQADFSVTMSVTRIHEDPRVTRPYTDEQWQQIDALGRSVDAELAAGDVRLTQGGEPTFVSIDDMDGAEWNFTAHSPAKYKLAVELLLRLQQRFAPGSLLHFGEGKWYPGEPLPRWALGIYWLTDRTPLWRDASLVADQTKSYGFGAAQAHRFMQALAGQLDLDDRFLIAAYEDAPREVLALSRLPVNVAVAADPLRQGAREPGETVAAYVLPLRSAPKREREAHNTRWHTSAWPLRGERVYLIAGDSPAGARLPLSSLPRLDPADAKDECSPKPGEAEAGDSRQRRSKDNPAPKEVVRTALLAQIREGRLYVFLPPIERLDDFIALIGAIERAAAAAQTPLWLEGYPPPHDARVDVLKVTPDPGVIEVNIHPARSWQELTANLQALYEDARQTRLGTEKFMLDGRHTGTGGGNHITLGGATPADSPMLRRPDLLRSLISYWQNHPALSYVFSGMFVGPTSQAPRVDEARDDNLYELEIAFQQMQEKLAGREEAERLSLVDRLLRNLLVDLTGNTHRAEFCIDKLYSPGSATGRLGLVEFRAFEMPPHAQMSLAQMLLLRVLVARFWKTPYTGKLIRWGTELHDRFMLPYFAQHDMRDVVREMQQAGYAFDLSWLAPFFEFRFPRYGTVTYDGIQLELRQAIEPWHVLGEEIALSGTSRYVDSSVERLQVKVDGMNDTRYAITCNGRPLPLHPTGIPGEYVAGVRYRAWAPPSALHPTIGTHSPLVFDVVDVVNSRSIGGCTYHVAHPGGRNYETFPVNANEAEARRRARFWNHGHSPGPMTLKLEALNPNFPLTLDLRRQPE